MFKERIIFANPNTTKHQEFEDKITQADGKCDFSVVGTIAAPIDLDMLKPTEPPTMIIFEGSGINVVSGFAANRAKKAFPGIYTVALSTGGFCDWADATVDLTTPGVDVIAELVKIEH